LRKIPTRLRGTNFCTSSARFAPSFVREPNSPECTQIVRTHQNVSLGSNGVDRVSSLRKIPTRLRGMNFCTSSARFAPSFVREPNSPECTQIVRTHQNVSLGSNGVDRVSSLRKIPTRLRGMNFCTSSARFAPSFVREPNSPECTQIVRTHQNVSLGSYGVDRVSSLRKIPTRLCGMNFCTSSARFAPSFVRQPNGPECTQIVRNAL
jgi:TorA maturation chaperone TorD